MPFGGDAASASHQFRRSWTGQIILNTNRTHVEMDVPPRSPIEVAPFITLLKGWRSR